MSTNAIPRPVVPAHFTVSRLTREFDGGGKISEQCGRITIAEDNWMGFSSIVSSVGVTLEKHLVFAPLLNAAGITAGAEHP